MPRADDPRVMVRLSPEDYAAIKAAATLANVSVGGLIRVCAVRYASVVAREAREGGEGAVRIRRARAVEAVRGQVVPASSLVVRTSESGVLMAERQRRLNEGRERAPKKR